MLKNKIENKQIIDLIALKKLSRSKNFIQVVTNIIFITATILFIQNIANAQTSALEQQCFNDVQGKVAYNQSGNKSWSPDNIRRLCKGTFNPSNTIACFKREIAQHNDWNRGIEACNKLLKPDEPVLPVTAFNNNNKPINQYSYLATHNATSSYAYGYSTQNSQRYDVTTQLDAGVRVLNIDFVYDTPDDKYPGGVYVCHCGDAPHSYSAIEKKRAKDKNMKSKIPLPFWSFGDSYTRFATVLMAIDKWLIANPNEIVFIATENHSATSAQFDAEVGLAGLKTRTYKKPVNGNWGTRAELIARNQRLVILAEDGVDLATSVFANPKKFSKWGGRLVPSFYGKENTFNPNDVGFDQFTYIGAFSTSPTDAITARYYNDYQELTTRKQEWTAKGYTRFPNFIFVNQVQVGDALRFVNELNGTDYQVAGIVPKDPFGNWIVNASADIGAYVKEGLTPLATELKNQIEGEKPKGRSISFNNQAGYYAKMQIIYFVNQTVGTGRVPIAKAIETPFIGLGITRYLEIPTDIASDQLIIVQIVGSGTVKKDILKTKVSPTFTGNLCYKSWGTIFDPSGGFCN